MKAIRIQSKRRSATSKTTYFYVSAETMKGINRAVKRLAKEHNLVKAYNFKMKHHLDNTGKLQIGYQISLKAVAA